MAIYKENIVDIDLGQGQIHRAFLNQSIGMFDQQADRFGIRVFRDKEPVELTDVSIQGVFKPPQGAPIAITGSTYTIVSGNVAEVILPQACYNYDGQFTLAIKLVDSTNSITGTMRIVDGMVDNTNASGTVAPTSAVPTYQEVLSVYDSAIEAVETVNIMQDKISDYNSENILPIKNSRTSAGVQFTSNGDGSYTVVRTGTSSSTATFNIIDGNGIFPEGIGAGEDYALTYDGQGKVWFQMFAYEDGTLNSTEYISESGKVENKRYLIPTSATGVRMRLRVPSSVDIPTPITVKPVILNAKSNQVLEEKDEDLNDIIATVLDNTAERIDWKTLGNSANPTGWRAAYYDNTTGEVVGSSMALCTYKGYRAPYDAKTLIAQSFSDGYGIEVLEYNESGTYNNVSYGSIERTSFTPFVVVPLKAGYIYKFNIGKFIRNGQSFYRSHGAIDNTKAWIVTSDQGVYETDKEIQKKQRENSTSGHIVDIPCDTSYMPVYVQDGDDIVINGGVECSDFIQCSSSYLYNIMVENGSSGDSVKYYIYFYDKNKKLVWTVLNETASTNEKNCFTAAELATMNGFQFSDLPDGYYMRVGASVTGASYRITVWDKSAFGLPVTALEGTYDENTFVNFPEDGACIISVPKEISVMIAKPGYTFIGVRLKESDGTYSTPANSSYLFPCQALRLGGYAGSSKSKNVIVVRNYDYSNGSYDKTAISGDLSSVICAIQRTAIAGEFIMEGVYGKAYTVSLAAEVIKKITWECKDEIVGYTGETFKEGVTYRGIPYRSDWTHPCYPGWHITKHTFLNAANDPDSIFYNGSENGPYYCQVCSSFGTLVAKLPYPMTNFSMMRDPNVNINVDYNPQIGTLCSNGADHCLIPVIKTGNAYSDVSCVTTVEAYGNITRYMNYYAKYASSELARGASGNGIRRFVYGVTPKNNNNVFDPPMNVESGSITNGSARPYRGDGSVYTSNEDVIINIKDNTANRLYYQKVDGTFSYGRPSGALTTVGDAAYISITAGATSAVLRSKTEDGSYTGADLESGAVYAVWASNGDSTIPDNAEYFEWHDADAEAITYTIENGELITDDEFWYARGYGRSYTNPIHGHSVGLVSIPYEAPKKSMDGETTAEHSDYSKYTTGFWLASDRKLFFFKKGKLGAYVIPGQNGEDPPGPEPD